MERKGRRDAVIILVIMIIIAAVIGSWLTGLWSCEAGRKDLTKEERLTIADYINSISILIQHSNKISINFFTAVNKIKDTRKDELEDSLSQIIEDSTVLFENAEELNPPESFEVAHGYLELVFDMRNKAYSSFKPAVFNIIQDVDYNNSSSRVANSFQYMYMSDEVYRYFQEELQKSGEALGINNLTIIDSRSLEDNNLLDTNNVAAMITDFKTATDLDVRRGVAIAKESIKFSPALQNENDDYLIIKNGTQVSISINIENQGNVVENDIPVKLTYKPEGAKAEEKTETIPSINPSEQKTVTFSGLTAYAGKKCEIIIDAGPVEGEALVTNNTETYKFMMEQ